MRVRLNQCYGRASDLLFSPLSTGNYTKRNSQSDVPNSVPTNSSAELIRGSERRDRGCASAKRIWKVSRDRRQSISHQGRQLRDVRPGQRIDRSFRRSVASRRISMPLPGSAPIPFARTRRRRSKCWTRPPAVTCASSSASRGRSISLFSTAPGSRPPSAPTSAARSSGSRRIRRRLPVRTGQRDSSGRRPLARPAEDRALSSRPLRRSQIGRTRIAVHVRQLSAHRISGDAVLRRLRLQRLPASRSRPERVPRAAAECRRARPLLISRGRRRQPATRRGASGRARDDAAAHRIQRGSMRRDRLQLDR